jgi:hypothetical protein
MAEIKIEDLTTGYVDGTGVFDVLMTAVGSRLEEQYQEDRIKGSDYATAYLGAMQYAMAQAMQFLLGKQQADAQAELIKAQTSLTIKQEAEIDANILLKAKELQIKDQELLIRQQELVLKGKEIELATKEIELKTQMVLTEQKKIALMEQQILELRAKITNETNLANSTVSVNTAQIDKIKAEKDLLVQKKATELVQTVNPSGGLIKAQYDLYNKQATGFNRDAEQKAAKTIIDGWSVMMTADPAITGKPGNYTSGGVIDTVISELWARAKTNT